MGLERGGGMNNRHRRVERLRRQQVFSSCKQYDVTPAEMVEKLYKDVSETVSNIVVGVGAAFINIGKAFMDTGEKWRSIGNLKRIKDRRRNSSANRFYQGGIKMSNNELAVDRLQDLILTSVNLTAWQKSQIKDVINLLEEAKK